MEFGNEVLLTIEFLDGEKVKLDAKTLNLYDGSCALCKWFGSIEDKRTEPDNGRSWLDDDGLCLRFPPVFIDGKFKQPEVCGGDKCGEYAKGWNLKG